MSASDRPLHVKDHQRRIVTVVTALFALAFSAAALSSWLTAASALGASLDDRLRDTTASRALAIDRYLERLRTVVNSYVRVIERTVPADIPLTVDTLESFREETGIDALYFGSSDGAFIGDLGWTPPADYDPRNRPWYQAAMMKSGQSAYSGMYTDLITGQSAVSFSSRVRYPDESVRGVLAVDIYLSTLSQELAGTAIGPSGYPVLIDDSATVLVHPSGALVGLDIDENDDQDSADFRNLFNSPPGAIREYGMGGGWFGVTAKLPSTGWILAQVFDRSEVSKGLRDLALMYGLILILSLGTVLAASRLLARRLSGFATLLEGVLDERNVQLRLQMEEIKRLSVTDPLTGIANRRALDSALSAEVLRARRSGTSLAALMLDIDHFKDINDHFGHETGDRALVTLARLATETIRDTDKLGRWGGEEFVVLCPETGETGASTLAGKLRARIEEGSAENGLPITCSVGWAVLAPEDTPTRLVSRADSGMYLAKRNGRNRVETVEGSRPIPGGDAAAPSQDQ